MTVHISANIFVVATAAVNDKKCCVSCVDKKTHWSEFVCRCKRGLGKTFSERNWIKYQNIKNIKCYQEFIKKLCSLNTLDIYREILEKNVAPFVLDVCENDEDTDDHGEDDGDHHYQPAVHQLHSCNQKTHCRVFQGNQKRGKNIECLNDHEHLHLLCTQHWECNKDFTFLTDTHLALQLSEILHYCLS